MSDVPGVPLDVVRDQLSAVDRDRLAGRDHRGAAPADTSGDQRQVACGLAGFPGRAARGVSEQRALSLPVLRADQGPRFPDGVELPSRPPCCTPRSYASTC